MKLQAIATNKGFAICPEDEERYKRFKRGCQFEIEVVQSRNPQFHKKVFALFNFCFNFWRSGKEFVDEHTQREEFRSNLIILAGFVDEVWSITGELTVRPKSLAFAKMEQEEFERCYSALINAALVHVFADADDITWNTLVEFF